MKRTSGVLVWLACVLGPAVFMVALCKYADATWKPQYAQLPPQVREWYESRILTPAAEARFHFHSCCAHSDIVDTKFRVDKSTGFDEWYWLDGTTWKQVPSDIIHWNEHAPNGEATLFVVPGTANPTCFYPPDAGI